MKRAALFALICALPAFAAAAGPAKPVKKKVSPAGAAEGAAMTEDQKAFYFFGNKVIAGNIQRNLQQFNLTPEETKYLVMGLSDALKNAPARVNDSYGPKLRELLDKKQAAEMEKEKANVKAEKEKAKAFLEKTAAEPGAQKLANGAVYIPIKEGAGAAPKAADSVKVHYHGTFTDGKVFDSSVERKTPAEFPLNGVISCWTEGVQKIKVGGKARLVCPSDTAYGDEGRPGAIPGGATLVFEVELLDIAAPPSAKTEAAPAPAAEAGK